MELIKSKENILRSFTLIHRRTWNYLDWKYREFGISGPQHIYITAVCRDPGLIQNSLCDPLGVDKSNVARNVKELVKKGFIERHRGKDNQKNWCLYPTDKALEIYNNLIVIYIDLMEKILQGLSHEDRELFEDILQLIEINSRTLLNDEKI